MLAHWKKSYDGPPFSSVTQSCLTLQPDGLQHAKPPCPSPTPRVYSNSCPLSRWYHPTISASVVPFSSLPSVFPSIRVFQMSQHFSSGGQSIGISASASVLPMNIQDWFPLGRTGWISLQSKGFSRVFSNTTIQKHQFLNPWLIHVNVWQKPLQYCKVISLQLIKINEKKRKTQNINSTVLSFLYSLTLTSIHDYWKNHSLD